MYPHDELLSDVLALGKMSGTDSWENHGSYSWSSLPKWFVDNFSKYEI